MKGFRLPAFGATMFRLPAFGATMSRLPAFGATFRRFRTTWLPHLVFWGWNLLFLSVAAFGIAPQLGEFVLDNTLRGAVPWSFTTSFLALLLIPPASIVVGIFWRRRPDRMIRFFYGIEAPLFVLCLVRLVLLKQLHAGLILLAAGFVVMIAFYAAHLVGRDVPHRRGWAAAQLAGTTLVLTAGLYFALLLAFYLIPLAWWIVREAFAFEWLAAIVDFFLLDESFIADLYRNLLWLAFTALFWVSAVLVLAVPVALPWFYIETWRLRFGGYREVLGHRRSVALSVAVLAAAVGSFALVNRQPQQEAFVRLEAPVSSTAEKRRLVEDSPRLRRGLVNAYLASYRYVSSTGENTHIRVMFKGILGGDYETYAGLEKVYNFLARPLIYDGDNMRSDQQRASDLYAELFDAPIQEAERSAIVRALEATWERDGIEAGLLDRNAEKVRVVHQDIRLVREEGNWAEIELYEVYRNRTYEQQEIFYSFSLPETAAITGLWLGNSADRADRDAYVVSTRGAAQAVYRQQVVRYRLDPALLEQIGPRQYRLRTFPVPPRPLPSNRREENGRARNGSAAAEADGQAELHLWMTFQTPPAADGWPLPRLIERRNVVPPVDHWLPAFLARDHDGRARDRAQTVLDTIVAGHRVRATRSSQLGATLPEGRFAAVLDMSRSMAEVVGEVRSTLDQLVELEATAGANGIDFDLYVTDSAAAPRRIDSVAEFDAGEEVFFGRLRPRDLLAQLEALRAGQDYRGVLLLTDDGAYDFADDQDFHRACPEPIWMVHLGDRMPAGYDDALLQAIETCGGGVTTSVSEVLDKLSAPEVGWVAGGYYWTAQPVGDDISIPASGFEQVAARQLIRARTRELSRRPAGGTEASTELDRIHAVARRYGVVTPYSSMIVLVNQAQRRALREAEAREDRFERESENGSEALSLPKDPFAVSGVPEPDEWILIILAGIALVVIGRMRWL